MTQQVSSKGMHSCFCTKLLSALYNAVGARLFFFQSAEGSCLCLYANCRPCATCQITACSTDWMTSSGVMPGVFIGVAVSCYHNSNILAPPFPANLALEDRKVLKYYLYIHIAYGHNHGCVWFVASCLILTDIEKPTIIATVYTRYWYF